MKNAVGGLFEVLGTQNVVLEHAENKTKQKIGRELEPGWERQAKPRGKVRKISAQPSAPMSA